MRCRDGMVWGAVGFLVAALVFKPLALAWWGLPAKPWVFVGVAALSVGVIEEGVRAAVLAWRRPTGRALVGVALGWALAEGLVVGVGGMVQLMALARDPAALAAARTALPAMAGEVLQRQVDGLSAMSAWAWPLERAAAAAVQIGLTALLAGAMARRNAGLAVKAGAIAAAMGLHAAVDLPAAAFQAGLWPLAPVQAVYAVLGIALAPWAWRWCRTRLRPARAATTG